MNFSHKIFRISLFTVVCMFVSLTAMHSCATKENAQDADRTVQSITGKSLREIRDWYSNELFNQFIPAMDKYVIDPEYGGFMCNVDIETGELLSTIKRAWWEGRGLWTYSFLYNNLMKDEKILEVAKKSADFIMKHKPEKGEFWPSPYTREGKILGAAERVDNDGDIYGNLFMAEGLAEYAKATGDKKYYDEAKSIMLDALEIYDNPEYSYHRISYFPKDAPITPGIRVLGHWMALLRTATQMLEYIPDPEIEKVADRCVEAIMNHHLNDQYQLLNEALNHDLSRPDNAFNQFAYLGHGIETLWMVMFEAERRKDNELLQRSMDAFKRHITVARDNVYGGHFRSLDQVDNNTWKSDKVLWLQEEVLIGALFMMEHSNDEWAQKCFAETYNYVCENFIREGYKFWTYGGDRKMENIFMNRAEHYHHPRHLMLNLLALNRIIGD